MFACEQRRFCLLLFRDVPGDLGSTNNLACFITDRRDCERHIDRSTVLPNADGFKMLDSFALPQSANNLLLFVDTFGRNETRHMLADDFRSRITEKPFGSLV